MEKQVALIVTDDLTDLNKRLASGYRIYNNYSLANGTNMFLLSKYVATPETSLTREAGAVPTRDLGYGSTMTLTARG